MDQSEDQLKLSPSETGPWSSLFVSEKTALPALTSERLAGKRVLITGAGGSIGSALAHAVAASGPQQLLLLDTSENGLYQVDRHLHEARSTVHIPVLGSVCDSERLTRLFAASRPQVVFHAAALKHVPLMEGNPCAAFATNAAGTLTLATIAAQHAAEHLILVSTDKAVDPRSMMGACKRLAELVLLALGATTRTRMTAVRLGNVIGSQGSVLPLFLEQIARGGPLTVTHPDARRYFLTMEHTVATLFAALEFPASPAVLVPALGEPIRIFDLARHLLEAHGSNARIEFTGLRPGDKLTEALLSNSERWAEPQPPGFQAPGLRAILGEPPPLAVLEPAMHALSEAAQHGDLAALLAGVAALVPEYQPSAVITAASNAAPPATSEAVV